jgi:hypothetical protein
MDREFVLNTIIDFYIRPQIYQKNFEIVENRLNNDEKRRLELDIKIMNEIREYLEDNLK